MTGILYLVATPIGNLKDITFRAIETLQTVDLIAAEDTRHTAKLLHHYQIKTPTISYHQHNHQTRVTELSTKLLEGLNIALVTDAGTPCISDPGYYLVLACMEANIRVIPIPGAMAAISGLVASGLSTERFCFEGFLPTKKKLRENRLNSLKEEKRTIIFYEAPHKLEKTLADLANFFGIKRNICLARELTKIHEDFWRGNLEKAIKFYENCEPKGEYTIIVEGNQEEEITLSETEIKEEIEKLLKQGMSKTEASQYLVKYTNLSRREIYQLMINQ
ncbi:16S rRNA (cytidine(1402)-2'-O)-methyltransferase [Geminocystis sp. GBBB08]|uniref:16S rRNA (cytidine(1402)-2'-O)-methyltransferase n=1 Tax=Geminocystis sp. GBBB08 TaxID=2604140 RepID=UPI002928F7CD|nr:16S rRNA (cytidine(1402)-2'-O)-methyltransferase [Geminocystis sp. GBBB08]